MIPIDYFETSDLVTYLKTMREDILEEAFWNEEDSLDNTFIVRLKDLRSYKIYYLYKNKQLLYTVEELTNEI